MLHGMGHFAERKFAPFLLLPSLYPSIFHLWVPLSYIEEGVACKTSVLKAMVKTGSTLTTWFPVRNAKSQVCPRSLESKSMFSQHSPCDLNEHSSLRCIDIVVKMGVYNICQILYGSDFDPKSCSIVTV